MQGVLITSESRKPSAQQGSIPRSDEPPLIRIRPSNNKPRGRKRVRLWISLSCNRATASPRPGSDLRQQTRNPEIDYPLKVDGGRVIAVKISERTIPASMNVGANGSFMKIVCGVASRIGSGTEGVRGIGTGTFRGSAGGLVHCEALA